MYVPLLLFSYHSLSIVAAQSGSAVAVSLLLSAGANVHTQLCGSMGATPLLTAIEHGHTEVTPLRTIDDNMSPT